MKIGNGMCQISMVTNSLFASSPNISFHYHEGTCAMFLMLCARLTYSVYRSIWLANSLSGRDDISFEDKSLQCYIIYSEKQLN